MPVWYAKQVTPSTEFQRFVAWESIRFNDHDKQDWYFAAMMQMQAKIAGGGEHTTVKDYLLDFTRETPKTADQFEAEQIATWENAMNKKASNPER